MFRKLLTLGLFCLLNQVNAAEEKKEPAKPTPFTYQTEKYLADGSSPVDVVPGLCQLPLGYQIYDLKRFNKRITGNDKAAVFPIKDAQAKATSNMLFKLCQADWNLGAEGTDLHPGAVCPASGQAFYGPVKADCKYSFGNPKLAGVAKYTKGKDGKVPKNPDEDVYSGFQVKWTSTEKCGADKTQNKVFALNVLCDAAQDKMVKAGQKTDFDKWVNAAKTRAVAVACVEEYTYYGYEGCDMLNLQTILGPILKFSGFIEIAAGFFLMFCGRPLLKYAVILLLFIGITGGVFMVSYNLGAINGLDQGKTTVFIVVACVCVLIGGIATFFINRLLTPERQVKILSTLGSAFLVSLVLAPTPLPSWAKACCIVIGGLLGYFLINQKELLVICWATGFIGSVLFFHGLGSFIGGFPNLAVDDIKKTPLSAAFFGYLAGIIVMTVIGAQVQIRRVPDNEGDEFAKEHM